MYKVLKNKRQATKTLFTSYEAARQWVRKQLRKQTTIRTSGQPYFLSDNPTLGAYAIRSVA